jgi:hypothetical protein
VVAGFAFLLVAMAVVTALEARNADHSLTFDATRPLLSLRDSATRQHALGNLDALLAQTDADAASRRPVVIYVHGRGNEPRKSFANVYFVPGNLLGKVENYDVSAIGFNWDARMRGNVCERPIARAAEAAPAFAELVNALAAHRASHPDFWRDRPLVLLAHSMGSYVLIESTKLGTLPQQPVFDRTVITGSDALAASQAEWLGEAAWGVDRVVFANPGDLMLRQSVNCERWSAKLGAKERGESTQPASLTRLGLLPLAAPQPSLLADVTYVGVPQNISHNYFVFGGQRGNPHVCSLFDAALHGKPLPVDPQWRVPGAANQFLVPASRERSNACFRR